jgi:hypothetical protein
MLNAAMVFMILGGILGLPAVLCSAACTGFTGAATKGMADAQAGQTVMEVITALGWIACAGSIILGALVKQAGKIVSGVGALCFAIFFAILLVQGNPLGILSTLLLLVAAIMIFVAPENQFRGVVRVEQR